MRIIVPVVPVPRNPPRATLPLLRHLHIDTCYVFSNTVAPAVALLAAHASGCVSVLARMLGRLSLRDPYDWGKA